MRELNRRNLLGGLLAGAAGAATALNADRAEAREACPTPKTYPNAHFYTPDGTLDVAKAKAAYYELMEFHNFPVMPVLKTDAFWVLDFALGKFTEVGMGGIFYINNERDDYLLHDIWLFPGQMIAEHYHVKTDKVAAKMEAWLVRHGSAWFGSEGEPSENANEIIPPTHRKCARARHVEFKKLGDVVKLETAEARHWVKAGPQGAIITEVATYHSMDALRFTHPDISLG
jgi:D-lyxose ketol-isomerase